jgi:hypothetical protein
LICKTHNATIKYGSIEIGQEIKESLPVYIRNRHSHGVEKARFKDTNGVELLEKKLHSELKESIDLMLDMI